MRTATDCNCGRSFSAVCAVLAAIGAALVLAGEQCARVGGQPSDSAWVCTADGAVTLLWAYVTPGIAALAALTGSVAYFAAFLLARRASS